MMPLVELLFLLLLLLRRTLLHRRHLPHQRMRGLRRLLLLLLGTIVAVRRLIAILRICVSVLRSPIPWLSSSLLFVNSRLR